MTVGAIYRRNLLLWGKTVDPFRSGLVICTWNLIALVILFMNTGFQILPMKIESLNLFWVMVPFGGLYIIFFAGAIHAGAAGGSLVLERDRKTYDLIASSPIKPELFAAESILSGLVLTAGKCLLLMPVIALSVVPLISMPVDLAGFAALSIVGLALTVVAGFAAGVTIDPSQPAWKKRLARMGVATNFNAGSQVAGLGVLMMLAPFAMIQYFTARGVVPGPTEVSVLALFHPLCAMIAHIGLHEPFIVFFHSRVPVWAATLFIQSMIAVLLFLNAVCRLRNVRDDPSHLYRLLIPIEVALVSTFAATLVWPPAPGTLNATDSGMTRAIAGPLFGFIAATIAILYAHCAATAGHASFHARAMDRFRDRSGRLWRQCPESALRFSPLIAAAMTPGIFLIWFAGSLSADEIVVMSGYLFLLSASQAASDMLKRQSEVLGGESLYHKLQRGFMQVSVLLLVAVLFLVRPGSSDWALIIAPVVGFFPSLALAAALFSHSATMLGQSMHESASLFGAVAAGCAFLFQILRLTICHALIMRNLKK